MNRASSWVVLMVGGLAAACNPDKPSRPAPGTSPPQAPVTAPMVVPAGSSIASGATPAPGPVNPASAAASGSAGAVASTIPSGVPSAPETDYSSTITVPSTIKPGEKRPFVLYLHGLGSSGRGIAGGLGVPALAADRRFVYAAPDGPFDARKQRFWNASKACCNFDNRQVDHVAALRTLLQQAAQRPEVDPKRLYVVGVSNGAFMAHRLACEVSEVTAIAALSGMGPAEGEPCQPKGPVAILQVHGDADDVIPYNGGQALKKASLPRHPSALDTMSAWAARDGCAKKPAAGSPLDLDEKLDGAETGVLRFPGCKAPVELWTVHGGTHFVAASRKDQELILDFLEKQKKP